MQINQSTKNEKKAMQWLLAMALAGLSTTSFADTNVASLTVTGSISPTACQITLSDNGTFDYGTISGGSLNQSDFTVPFPNTSKSIDLTITCNPKSKVGIATFDTQKTTIVPGAIGKLIGGQTDDWAYGLGTAGGKNIGVYYMFFDQTKFVADTVSVRTLISNDKGQTWADNGSTGITADGKWLAWGPSGNGVAATPLAFSSLTGKISVNIALNKASELPLTAPIPLNGSATLQLQYL